MRREENTTVKDSVFPAGTILSAKYNNKSRGKGYNIKYYDEEQYGTLLWSRGSTSERKFN